jgi:hypothetical protein
MSTALEAGWGWQKIIRSLRYEEKLLRVVLRENMFL